MKRNISATNRTTRTIKCLSISLIILALLVVGGILYNVFFKNSETYTVVNGYVEKATDTQGVIIKQEKVLELNNNNSIIPLTEQGKRVRKQEAIAIYQNSKYQEYNDQINEIDKQIEILVKDLPEIYSNDISYIENQIEKLGKESRKITSYIKMQEYKTKIDELSTKKVSLLGELSPSGSKVRELIDKRKKIEENYKSSSDNIKAPMSGCVTYKIDGLENSADIEKLTSYNVNDLNTIFSKYSTNLSNDFGIKIINNFISYIVIKTDDNEYIREGNRYYLDFTDNPNFKESAVLSKVVDIDEKNKYCVFKISNGVENLVDSRIENIKVIWTKKTGMAIPLDAINLNENTNIGNVTIIKNGDYITVPVKIILSNENIAIVDNLSDEDEKNNNIQSDYELEVYDQLLIKE